MSVKHNAAKADLYQFVFGFRPLRLMVAVMFTFFVLHPAMPAFASEEISTNVTTEVSVAPEPEPELEQEPEAVVEEPEVVRESMEEILVAADTEALNGETLTGTAALITDEESADAVTGDTATATNEPVEQPEPQAVDDSEPAGDTTDTVSERGGVMPDTDPDDSQSVVGTDTESEPETETEGEPDSTPAVDETTITPSASGGVSGASNTEAASDDEVLLEQQASTTVPEPEFYEVVSDVEHTSDLYQFNRQQCVSMGSGAYHCFDASAERFGDTSTSLRAERDAEGDKEIYLTTENGKTHQLTNNRVDDDAPYYDAVSDSIVWHRLMDGRYQIVSYQDERETVISDPRINSMEPNRSGVYTVWQAWVGEAWQVVLHDGSTARVISNAAGQHIAPQVEGDYVIWNVTNGNSHTVAVYEIATGLVSLIDDEEGARVSNPRFVLVYDTRFDNGDVITKGYDAETGSVVPLSASAPVVPEELPSSDQTGEVRALLQNKTTSREDSIEGLDTGETTASSTVNTASSTVGAPDLVAASTTDATALVVPATTTIPNLPLDDFDIIVTPYSTTTSSQ